MRSKNNNSISNRFISHLIVSTVHSHTSKTTSRSTRSKRRGGQYGSRNYGDFSFCLFYIYWYCYNLKDEKWGVLYQYFASDKLTIPVLYN